MFLRSIFAAWLAIFAFPQTDPPRLIGVRVWVNAMAKNGLDAEIAQHTVKALERLPNVTVADRFPYHYELQIVGLKESDNVALGVAALRIFDNSEIADEFGRYRTDGLYENIQLAVVTSKYDTCKRCAVRSQFPSSRMCLNHKGENIDAKNGVVSVGHEFIGGMCVFGAGAPSSVLGLRQSDDDRYCAAFDAEPRLH